MRVTITVLLALLFAGCGLQVIEHHATDASVDAPIDGAGSGSAMAVNEPSPRDGNLEVMVIVSCVVVVLGPANALRRRRTADDTSDPPPFS